MESKLRPYTDLWDNVKTAWFIVPFIITLAVNFGANYGLEYATLTQWGKESMVNFLSYTCIAMDVCFTSFFIAYFTTLLGPNTAVDGIKKGKMAPVLDEAVSGGIWRFFPMKTTSTCKRSLLAGVEVMVTVGVVTVILFTIIVGDGVMDGITYCWFKAIWATVVAACIFPFCHFSAVTMSKFPDWEASHSLLSDGGSNAV